MRIAPLLAVPLLLLAGAAGCRSQPAQPTDVLVIVVDTLRADRLGAYGYPRGLTPVMDGLAARGARFANAYAPSSWTMPSVASLLTSRLPEQHLVRDFDSRLADSEVTIGERLADAGFTTGGFTANWRLSAALGYGQGFAVWQGFLGQPGQKKARGDAIREAALAWVDRTRTRGTTTPPRLLYLQYMEPHVPLEAPRELRARFAAAVDDEQAAALNKWALMMSPLREKLNAERAAKLAALYDAEVAAMDAELGRLLDGLAERGVLDTTLVVLTSDHGEEFLEHGAFGHGYNLFNTTVHVPLVIAGPGIPAGIVVQEPVSLIDLAPTLLALYDLAPEPRFEGRSLLPLLAGAAPAGAGSPDIVLQLPRKGFELDLRLHRDGLVRGSDKLLVGIDDVGQIYDLAADPGEQTPHDLPPDAPLRRALDATLTALGERRQAQEQKVEIDDATKEKLRALGYHH